MPFELVTIPCLSDNYVYLLHATETGETAVIDVPEAGPILAELKRRNWQLSEIWLTHHHWDHVDGTQELRDATGAQVVGAASDAHRLPPLNHTVTEGEPYNFAGATVDILDVPGHTVGHIAYYVASANAAFTGDSLMALGCGRLFEGTAEQMWTSMGKFSELPDDTLICSGHEYSETNAGFALTIEPENLDLLSRNADISAKRAKNLPTVPTSLQLERATNPYLRCHLTNVKSSVGLSDAPDAEVFATIRQRKDKF